MAAPAGCMCGVNAAAAAAPTWDEDKVVRSERQAAAAALISAAMQRHAQMLSVFATCTTIFIAVVAAAGAGLVALLNQGVCTPGRIEIYTQQSLVVCAVLVLVVYAVPINLASSLRRAMLTNNMSLVTYRAMLPHQQYCQSAGSIVHSELLCQGQQLDMVDWVALSFHVLAAVFAAFVMPIIGFKITCLSSTKVDIPKSSALIKGIGTCLGANLGVLIVYLRLQRGINFKAQFDCVWTAFCSIVQNIAKRVTQIARYLHARVTGGR